MVATAVVGFSDGHGVVCEVDIAVVACGVSVCDWQIGEVGILQKSIQVLAGSFRAVRRGILIFGHVEKDLPKLWNLCGRAVAVGASDAEAW